MSLEPWKIKFVNTGLQKYVFIDKLGHIVNKCNNTYHSTIKKKPVDIKSNTLTVKSKSKSNILNLVIEILNLKLVILLKYQNMNIFLQTFLLQIGTKKFSWRKNLKILCRGHILLIILIEKLIATFHEKNWKK